MIDKIIIGAGLYGLFSAFTCAKKQEKVLVLECDDKPFSRATFINQARIHMGYHYPRSYSTAIKSANYFHKFINDFDFCINKDFEQIYATSKNFSWTTAAEFKKFCRNAKIKCEDAPLSKYFKEDVCDGAFLTEEYTYDALILKNYFIAELNKFSNVEIKYNTSIFSIEKGSYFLLHTNHGDYKTEFLLNTTYASINQIINQLEYDPFRIKYELCEIILCKVNDKLKKTGITVMDGPFFSIMPFGNTGLHSLTSVTFTPHSTSYSPLPTFECQKASNGYCSPNSLGNCNICKVRPKSAWKYMSSLARKYMKDDISFEYDSSLFSVKPILLSSEINDSRPTIIKVFSKKPTFISVLSGKINTVYDLEEVLFNGNE